MARCRGAALIVLAPGARPCQKRVRMRVLVRATVAAAGLASVLGAARSAHADEPERPTEELPGEYPRGATQPKLILAGAATTAAWYGAAVGFSYLWPDAPGAEDLRIPVAGPWMALGDTGCADDNPNCSTFTVVLRAVLTAIDGVGQAGGLAVVIEGLFLPTAPDVPVRDTRKPPALRLRPVPVAIGKDTLGFGVVGQF